MIHKMNLNDGPFDRIKEGTKTVELRLYDEKRQKLKVGDQIEFTSRSTQETIVVEIVGLSKYQSFKELYNDFNKISLGYSEDEYCDPKDMEQYYSIDEQKRYGVVGIQIKLKNRM